MNQKTIQLGWCDGCNPDNCSGCATAQAAPAQAGEYPPLECDYCGALTPDPWHSSGMMNGKMSKHIHSCDSCAARGVAKAAPVDATVQQDAERWKETLRHAGSNGLELLTTIDAAIAARAAQGGVMFGDFKEGLAIGFVISTLITLGFVTWVRNQGRDECDNKLPRTEKCVQVWVPEKAQKGSND